MLQKRTNDNPVFYVQYAHARICSVIQQFADKGGDASTLAHANLTLLTAPSEAALMLKLAEFPAMRAGAARRLRVISREAIGDDLATTYAVRDA